MARFLQIGLLVLFFSLSLLFMRCGSSSISSAPVTDPSLLRVNVNLSRSTDYDGHITESIEAFIRDAKNKTVANPQVVVKVNGIALALNNGSSNYYGAYPHYQLTDSSLRLDADAEYLVTITLSDGKEYELGTVQTQSALVPSRFTPPAKHSRQQPLTLNWHDLEPHNWLVSHWKSWLGETSQTELSVSKSNRIRDAWGNVQFEGGSPDEADYLKTTIGSGQGTYTLPDSYFRGPLFHFNTLELLLSSEKSLRIKKPFLEGSAISCHRTGMYRIEVTD